MKEKQNVVASVVYSMVLLLFLTVSGTANAALISRLGVPEPSSLVLFGLGLVGLGLLRRRRLLK